MVIEAKSSDDGDGGPTPPVAAMPRRSRTGTVLSWSDVRSFTPKEMNFDSSNSGIQAEFPVIDDDADEMDYFQAFFDDEVMKMI